MKKKKATYKDDGGQCKDEHCAALLEGFLSVCDAVVLLLQVDNQYQLSVVSEPVRR